MAKEYAVFVENIEKDLPEGREVVLTIKDLTAGPRKYENRVVKAIISSSPAKIPGSDVLRVRSWTGVLYPQPWAIKIVEEMGEVVPGIPHGETLQSK
jgi:hypothetical protein